MEPLRGGGGSGKAQGVSGTTTAKPAAPTSPAPVAPEEVKGWQMKSGRPQAPPVGQADASKWGVAKKTDRTHDGQLLGADGKFYAADTPLDRIPAVQPNNGKPVGGLIVEIDGIMTPAALHAQTAQALANTGAEVISIHNATEGMLSDLTECVKDKLAIGKNPAVDTATRVLWDALEQGKPIHLAGHSQGALIWSRALSDVKNRMMLEKGMTAAEATAALGKVKVDTYGGASQSFVDGPQYSHWVNKYDLIPWTSGIGGSQRHPFSTPGSGAVVHVFSDMQPAKDLPSFAEGVVNLFARTVDRTIHGPVEVYYKERK